MKWLFSSVFGVFAIFLIGFGCLFAGVGGAVYYFAVYTLNDWVEVPGVVTGFQSNTSTDTDGFTTTYYCPTVAYTATNGEAYEININECSSPPAFETGDTVRVIYDPAAPGQPQLRGGTRDLIGNIFGLVFGGVGCLIGLVGAGFAIFAIVAAARKSRPSGVVQSI